MTFLEAAIEILRSADGPLHFSDIAQRAVEQNLLSHVGRDPESAMRNCLTSAARNRENDEDGPVVRTKPGHYALNPEAKLPEPKQTAKRSAPKRKSSKRRGGKQTVASDEGQDAAANDDEGQDATGEARAEPSEGRTPKTGRKARKTRRKRSKRSASNKPKPEPDAPPSPVPPGPPPSLEFEAPSGSGLEGVTDVAVVMANAMSRLVEERPELRGELEAMQQQMGQPNQPEQERTPVTRKASPQRERNNEERSSSRRRRRRRRRGKRVEWAAGSEDAARAAASITDQLLDDVAAVLDEAGARSLHVRQIAETLAGKGVLGGEISEIERAVTAAILMDIHTHGRASRFVARGDARYQLHGTRLPEPAAKAEQALRDAVRTLERETSVQLENWLQSLGARALESLVRIYLQQENYSLVAALPPNRGLGKLVVEDQDSDEDNNRTLVLVVPKRTTLDPKLWEGEAERNNCDQLLVFAMGEVPDDVDLGDARIFPSSDLGAWLCEQGIGVNRVSFGVTVLDPHLIESIGGLDT